MHSSPTISEGEKKKPAVIDFYNANKVGVDVVDQMLRKYSTRCATRRYSLLQNDVKCYVITIFFNKLCIANI